MTETVTTMINGPAWVDLSSPDAGASRDFYGKLFGWNIEVNPDPQYGGYALAKINGVDVAGIGRSRRPTRPSHGPSTSGRRMRPGLAARSSRQAAT